MLGPGFNPPIFTDTFTEDAFRSEYWSVHSAVVAALSTLGTQGWSEDDDFCANEDWGHSRFIGVELVSRRLWRADLLPLIQSVLLEQPQPYRVYLEHDLLDEPKFYLFVQPDIVLGYVPTEGHRRGFGL